MLAACRLAVIPHFCPGPGAYRVLVELKQGTDGEEGAERPRTGVGTRNCEGAVRASPQTTYLRHIRFTLTLSPFLFFLVLILLVLLILFFFLLQPAPVLGNVTELKVAFYVQDLQVLQSPEGAFHHRAHSQLVKPGQATVWLSARSPALGVPTHRPQKGKGREQASRWWHQAQEAGTAKLGMASPTSAVQWATALGQGLALHLHPQDEGQASLCIHSHCDLGGAGRGRCLLSVCPLALTSRSEALGLSAWGHLGAWHIVKASAKLSLGQTPAVGRWRLGSNLSP